MKSSAVAAVLAASAFQAQGTELQASAAVTANPIRKVVTMLQNIEKKVAAEGKAEEKLFEKYMCYCKNSGGDLAKSIDGSTAKIPEVESAIKEAEAQKVQLGEDLQKHRADREAAKAAMSEATSLREKEASTFAAYKAEQEANIKAVDGAVAALEKGMAGSFLQSSTAGVLVKAIKASQSMLETDRQDVLAFLSGSSSSDYAPSSGEITGILKTLGEEFAKDLSEATATEEEGVTGYDGLMSAKKKEIDAATAAIEDKTVREGEVAVSIAQMKNDLSDTAEALVEDKKFMADLEKNCKTKEAEWDSICKTRQEELLALADTIKLLNDDDSLELFKKALPSAASSFVQVEVRSDSVRQSALAAIQKVQKSAKRPQLDFIALALRGKKMGFEKVIAMIDEMAGVLKKEQVDDDNKKEYCEVQFESLDDKKKELERSVSDSEKAIEDSKEAIATLTSEIAALEDSIKELDKSVAEATEQRKAENEDFTTLMAQDTAAQELLGVAKNRLNKFYNPKLYKAPPKVELSEEDRITVNMGGTLAPTPAPGGIAGTGITVLADVSLHSQSGAAPPPPPEAPGAFKKKGEESNGVIAMMDLLVADLEKEMTTAEQEEKDAQADYEQMQKDAEEKRAADSTSLTEKGAAKGDTEAQLQAHKDAHASASGELMATLQVIQQTHGECDWLMQYYDMRKEAREGELEALSKAKAVLNGADYSLLQTKSARKLRGSA